MLLHVEWSTAIPVRMWTFCLFVKVSSFWKVRVRRLVDRQTEQNNSKTVYVWGESASELMIVKKKLQKTVHRTLAWVFLPFVHVVF